MKARLDRNGLHMFDRASGVNILLQDVASPSPTQGYLAPRYVSIALTNACDLACPYCYAPKHAARLSPDRLEAWLLELDQHSCLGIGFGGGEPTFYPGFARLCGWAARTTNLAVSFTTHGHRLTDDLCAQLSGSVHFVRISMDGVGATYEALRGRSFERLTTAIQRVRSIAPFGINFVVNADTLRDLDEAAAFAEAAGAVELLLLPQRGTGTTPAVEESVLVELERWISKGSTGIRLAISEQGAADGLPLARPFDDASPLDAHAHIDASGVLKASSFDLGGVVVDESVMAALTELKGSVES